MPKAIFYLLEGDYKLRKSKGAALGSWRPPGTPVGPNSAHPKGPKYLYGTKYGFCSSNFPYGLGKYSPYGYLGPFGPVGC